MALEDTPASGEPVTVFNREESERSGTPLLVLLHGIGAHERDLWPIVDLLPAEYTVASLRAPLAYGPGFSWFDLTITPDAKSYDSAGVLRSLQWLSDWIDGMRSEHSSVSLLGFSQGMAMATGLLRMNPRGYAATVGLSGFVTDPNPGPDSPFQDAELADIKPPYFWGRDQADPVVFPQWVEETNTWLQAHVNLTKVLYTGMGHGINAQEIGHVSEFLKSTLPGKG